MEYVIAAVFDDYLNAHLVQGRLENENINCWLKDEHTISTYPGSTFAAGGIKLMVAKPQIERALNLINDDHQKHHPTHSCPRCGSNNVGVKTSPRTVRGILGTIASFLLKNDTPTPPVKTARCFDCDYEYEVE